MKKIISALLICMLAAVCLFTGCSKAKGLKVKDSSGNDRVLVTDENGKPVYDEAGNIVVVDTDEKGKAKKDENGEQATNAIALDYLLVSGKNAYCRYFTFTQPSGYADIGEVITSLKAQGFNPEVNDETKTLCGEDAKFTEIKVSANGREAFMVSALFEKNGVTYACTYKTSKAGANTGDFESIVNSISFR